jgi:hypothetical protein
MDALQPDFRPFQKIARLSRDIIITEKIDGTNGVIFIPDVIEQTTLGYEPIYAGSRNRWVTPGKQDNHGFAAWVYLFAHELIDGLGPGYHFGEWWGQGIQRGYGMQEKRFSLFNPFRYKVPLSGIFSVVPILYEGAFSEANIIFILGELQERGSSAAPGFMDPEGIVIYHTASKTLFKKTIIGDEKPKGSAE